MKIINILYHVIIDSESRPSSSDIDNSWHFRKLDLEVWNSLSNAISYKLCVYSFAQNSSTLIYRKYIIKLIQSTSTKGIHSYSEIKACLLFRLRLSLILHDRKDIGKTNSTLLALTAKICILWERTRCVFTKIELFYCKSDFT